MEKNMETATMGYMGTTIRTHSFQLTKGTRSLYSFPPRTITPPSPHNKIFTRITYRYCFDVLNISGWEHCIVGGGAYQEYDPLALA